MLRQKSYITVIHLAAWLLFMTFPLLFLNNHGQSTSQLYLLRLPAYWLFCLTYIVIFYVNSNLLIPSLLLKKKFYNYATVFLLILGLICFLQPFDRLLLSSERIFNTNMQRLPNAQPGEFGRPPVGNELPPDAWFPPPPPDQEKQNEIRPVGPRPPGNLHVDSTSVFIFLMIIGISTAIELIHQWQLTDQRAARAEADKASAELSFLKAQINPHFLFNTLNNIYTLALMNSEHTAESIMKLSNIMRYVTDEVSADFVPLENEVDCLRDYIALQKLRIGSNTTVHFEINGNPAGKEIMPLVLMPFVENVFKHGVSKNMASAIDIGIEISNTAIIFLCKNQIFAGRNTTIRTGIGIENTRHRLNHLYAGKHLLTITEQNEFYTVQLILQVVQA